MTYDELDPIDFTMEDLIKAIDEDLKKEIFKTKDFVGIVRVLLDDTFVTTELKVIGRTIYMTIPSGQKFKITTQQVR